MSDWMSCCWVGQRVGSKISEEIRWGSHQLSGVSAVYLEGLDGLLETLGCPVKFTWHSGDESQPPAAWSCHCRSDSPWRTRGLLAPSSWQPLSSPESNRTDWASVAVRCVTAAWVGGSGHAERSALIGWSVIAQYALFEVHWTTLLSGFLSQEWEGSILTRTLHCECSTVWQYDPNRLM